MKSDTMFIDLMELVIFDMFVCIETMKTWAIHRRDWNVLCSK